MNISIFLSISTPINSEQEKFLENVKKSLVDRGFEPRTLGVTDYDINVPLAGCRRLMLECNGLITIAFRRNKIEKGLSRPGKNDSLDGKWTTSAFCHIEPAMAYQMGLPILIFREKDVIEDGVLERGVVGQYMLTFDLENEEAIKDYFNNAQYLNIIDQWGYRVQTVWNKKGNIDQF